MASNMGVKEKKTDYTMLVIYGIAVVAVIVICTWCGYVLEMTVSPKKGVQWLKALNEIGEYANPVTFVNAFGQIFVGNGITKKGFIIGMMGAALIVLYKLSSGGKRYHRKGSEHGSARWGNAQEKKIIADTTDFYNNVICASDVFLVLDRKKREENENAGKKQKKKKQTKKSAPENVEYVYDEEAPTEQKFDNEKLTLTKIAEMR